MDGKTPRPDPSTGLHLVWTQCAMCWGQGRILEVTQAPNGEGAMHRIYPCEACLGMGQDVHEIAA